MKREYGKLKDNIEIHYSQEIESDTDFFLNSLIVYYQSYKEK